jgi:predicted Zn-dependent protease
MSTQSNESNSGEGGGFQQSATRSALELILVLGVLAALVGGVFLAISRASEWVLPLVPVAFEEKIGALAFEATALNPRRCTNEKTLKYVEGLMQKVVAASKDTRFPMRVTVIDEKVPNAFALPGGFVVVHEGLLSTAEDGAEVAAVLAHEWAHVTHRHGLRRVLRAAGTGIALGGLLGGTDVGVLAGYAEDLVHLSYDRDQESEADETGRNTLRRAGVDPTAMGRFFLRLKEATSLPEVPSFLSSHPDLFERAQKAAAEAIPSTPIALPSPKGLSCR